MWAVVKHTVECVFLCIRVLQPLDTTNIHLFILNWKNGMNLKTNIELFIPVSVCVRMSTMMQRWPHPLDS